MKEWPPSLIPNYLPEWYNWMGFSSLRVWYNKASEHFGTNGEKKSEMSDGDVGRNVS